MTGVTQLLSKLGVALYAGAVAGLGSLATALVGGRSFTDVSDGQWVAIALTALLAGGGAHIVHKANGGSP